jgi:isoquinoline 1-oxidoreductase beta subunit
MLRTAAAREFGAPVEACLVERGRIHHPSTGRSLGFGDVAEMASRLPVPHNPRLKEPSEWRLIGSRIRRIDSACKLDGSAVYGIDVKVPGLLIGAVQQCPVLNGALIDVDATPALALPGVRQVLRLPAAVVVLASDTWTAFKGLSVLKPHWTDAAQAAASTSRIAWQLADALAGPASVVEDVDDATSAPQPASDRIEAVYEVPFLAHATMEPLCATAHVTSDHARVWAGVQAPGPTRRAVAHLLGFDEEQVVLEDVRLGGGFGRRLESDFVLLAVEAARRAGAPVKLVWAREEDIRHDFYRPAAKALLRADLDPQGRPSTFLARVASPSILARTAPELAANGLDATAIEGLVFLPYAIGRRRIEYAKVDLGVPVGFWRSIGHSYTGFFVESFVDEMAHRAGKDPVAYRSEIFSDDDGRLSGVLHAAADLAEWGTNPPPGHHRGIALHRSFGSLVACVAEISVDAARAVRVHCLDFGVDCGLVINPDIAEAQVEGSAIFALSAAFFGEIEVEAGAVRQSNFHDYPVLRMSQTPRIRVRFVGGTARPGGIGEPAVPPVAPAIANAIFAATGERIRRLPFRRSGYEIA